MSFVLPLLLCCVDLVYNLGQLAQMIFFLCGHKCVSNPLKWNKKSVYRKKILQIFMLIYHVSMIWSKKIWSWQSSFLNCLRYLSMPGTVSPSHQHKHTGYCLPISPANMCYKCTNNLWWTVLASCINYIPPLQLKGRLQDGSKTCFNL